MDFQPTTIESNKSGWRETLTIILLPLLVLFFPIIYLVFSLRRWYSFRTYRFWVQRDGRDAIQYQERQDGRIERITIEGAMAVSGPHVVYIPTEQEWREKKPAWAQGRREEIIARVKRRLGTRNYEYNYN